MKIIDWKIQVNFSREIPHYVLHRDEKFIGKSRVVEMQYFDKARVKLCRSKREMYIRKNYIINMSTKDNERRNYDRIDRQRYTTSTIRTVDLSMWCQARFLSCMLRDWEHLFASLVSLYVV